MFPQDFTTWRERHGLSQGQAAKALGKSIRSINAMENGAADVPVSRMTMLACRAIDLDPSLINGGEGETKASHHDDAKAAFRRLQQDFGSLPDRDAIKRVIDLLAA